jgi:DNA polymerase
MKKLLFVDTETRGTLDLELVGAHNYLSHSDTEIILLSWAVDDGPVYVWEPHKSLIPKEFLDEIYDENSVMVNWNSTFERLGLKNKLDIAVPIQRILDAMVIARHCSLPSKLDKCCEVLKLGADSKIDGTKLKALFCYPAHLGGEETLFGISPVRFNDWNSHPAEWENFKEYVKYDVISMRKICKLLKNHPLPQSEIEGFWLDQKINDHGIPVDLNLVQKMDKIATKAKDIANTKIREISGVENPNSRPQLLGWLEKEGYPFKSLGKPFVNSSLDDIGMSQDAVDVLNWRMESAKTSDSKLEALKLSVCSDGTVKDLFGFLGASRTGRWNSHGAQFANQPRPVKIVDKNFDLAIRLIE